MRLVAHNLRLDHHADFAPGLNGEASLHAGEGGGELLELFKTLDVIFQVLTSGAGTGRRNGVGRLNDAGDDRLGFHIPVVGVDGVDDRLIFFVLPGDVHADVDVGTLDLVVERLADVVQQAGAAGDGGSSPSSEAIMPER